MKNLSFDHVHYRSSNLELTRKFYIDTMEGIELPSEELGGNKNLHFMLGGVSLLFVEAGPDINTDSPDQQLGVYHIAFLVDDCVEATNYYFERGAEVAKVPKVVGDNIMASFLTAPDGMSVELKQIIQ